MTLVKVKNLYEQDFALWVEETVKYLRSGNFQQVDLVNLIEEVESLGRSDQRELESRLITLFEQALKRKYVPLPDCYRGWEVTINRTQQKLNRLLRDSPSLKSYFLGVLADCYQDGLKNLRVEYDINFSDVCPFPYDVDELLNSKFWAR